MKPSGLTELTLMMCAFNPTAFLFLDVWRTPRAVAVFLTGLVVLFGYVVLWYFWEGRNWARLLVLVVSVLTLFNVFQLLDASPLQGAVMVMEIMLSGFLLYWLNTAAVRAFFVRGHGVRAGIVLPGLPIDAPPPPPSLVRRIGVPWIALSIIVCLSAAGLVRLVAPEWSRWIMLRGMGIGLVVTLPPYLICRNKGRLAFGERSLLAGAVIGSLGGLLYGLLLAIILTIVAILKRPVAGNAASAAATARKQAGITSALRGPWPLRAALGVALALAAALLWSAAGFARPDYVDDRAGVLDPRQMERFEKHLAQIRYESNVDLRFVLVATSEGDSLDEVTAREARSLEIEGEQRRALFVLDPSRHRLRVAVGPTLQEVFDNAFVGYLTRHHVHSLAEAGDADVGLRLTLRLLQSRIRRAALGGEYDPRPAALIEERAAGTVVSEDETRRRFVPQRTVNEAFHRYLEWLLDGPRYSDVALFTAESQAYLARLPISRALAESDLLLEYGKTYDVLVRGDRALLYFTDDPLPSPHFFRRSPAGWQMDILAEVEDTREHNVGSVPWSLVERNDEITHTFIDRYTVVDSALRIAGGDNRRLRTTDVQSDEWGDSVLTRMLVAVTPDSVRLPVHRSFSTPPDARKIAGLQQITAMQAAGQIAAAKGKPVVVLFYDAHVFSQLDFGGQRQFETIFATLRRCQQRGAQVLAFSTDVNAAVLHGLPDYLRANDAPFSAVSLYPWPRGQLKRAMASIDIPMDAGWAFPVVLVLDRDGRVAMRIQKAFSWETRSDLDRVEAMVGELRRGEGRRAAQVASGAWSRGAR